MATDNGSPIPVDQLPSYYVLLSDVQLTQEAHLAISMVLLYEYFLTLDQEIEFIWRQSWKISSGLYIFVRYFGTLYNLVSTILTFLPLSIPLCGFALNLEPWAGFAIWWSVQGILQMRLYALYRCSKKLLVFMMIGFVGEVGSTTWMLISTNLSSRGSILVFQISFPGDRDIDLCMGAVSGAFTYIWVPCLVFEAMLCLLAIYAGIKYPRRRSAWWSTKTNRPRLIDVLAQGNVIYFLSPLGMFILLVIHSPNLKIQSLADDLLFRVPFTILAGCRLILSIREATSRLQSDQSVSNFPSTVIFGDRSNLSHA